MTDKLIVFVTCETRQQAESIAESIVTDKLAACVNILPGIRSCYVWEGALTWSDEVLLLVKTTRGRYEQVEARIRSLHSYEVPEIVAVELEDGLDTYLTWIDRSVGG